MTLEQAIKSALIGKEVAIYVNRYVEPSLVVYTDNYGKVYRKILDVEFGKNAGTFHVNMKLVVANQDIDNAESHRFIIANEDLDRIELKDSKSQ